jgi:RNA polymerase sigma-70 factor (sigma-E family)
VRISKAQGDTSFAAFMDEAGPALLRTAWFLTGDVDRAQELTQAALVRTYVVWHKIDHHTARAYARRCLVNHKIDVWRATRHEVPGVSNAGVELTPARSQSRAWSGDDAVAGVDQRDDLARRLSRLPEQQRKVVVLRYYTDQSEAAVAEALGISVGSVKSAASRGLAALRRQDEPTGTALAMNATSPTNASSSSEGTSRLTCVTSLTPPAHPAA